MMVTTVLMMPTCRWGCPTPLDQGCVCVVSRYIIISDGSDDVKDDAYLSLGLPHSSHSVTVRGIEGSLIVLITSTNGTSATAQRNSYTIIRDVGEKGV